ncbi:MULTISPECIES: hypothetical protein [Bacillus subtilis group]|uniref:hypothetical protein n=1 Tax=Bacillus subtilis group TaxID=653685 RepID=UPI0002F02BB8|nr:MULTISPECIES: hypothetical protein [Bacillus subtilis group]AKQ73994.1 hypothetical protein MUY_002862 [Bacillus licheniformis WX-02]MDE1392102.1 hypothetical protein [Bacillus paralicheniformis]MEC1037723.1 hypothetical protein [Bacillus licheniformis]QSV42535.1 hypothetical protein G6536_14145 [Bacillus licheniformis]
MEITKETLNFLIISTAAMAATLIGIFSLILTAKKRPAENAGQKTAGNAKG